MSMVLHRPIPGPVAHWLVTAMCSLALAGCSGQPVDGLPPPPPPPPGPPPPLPPPPPPEEVTATVSVDTLVRFQQMHGWEAVAAIGQTDYDATPWAEQVVALAVDDLGLNRLRVEVRSGSEHPQDNFARWRSGAISDDEWRNLRYASVNDNADPQAINAGGFHWTELDRAMDRVVVPMRNRMQARGETLYLNLNYVSFANGGVIHGDAQEYAEFILAAFQHLQGKYGFVPDAVEVILEPDNNTIWSPGLVGAAIVAAGNRLAAAGFHPEFIAPSTTSMAHAISWFDGLRTTPGVLGFLRELSYHRYTGVSDANLIALAQRGAQYGVRTAMLEHIGSGAEDLYNDLTLANASAWQQFALAFPGNPSNDNGGVYYIIANNVPVIASRTRELRQYFRYVRFGAWRVQAGSDNGRVRPVGFTNPGGGTVVVMHLAGGEVLAVEGLRPGRYAITTSIPNLPVLGEANVDASGELRFSTSMSGVFTAAWIP